MAKQIPMRVTPTDEIRNGFRKYIIHIQYQEPCYWWTDRPADEVKATVARRNKAMLDPYNFNGALDFD